MLMANVGTQHILPMKRWIEENKQEIELISPGELK
jgi:hypothetical protein